MELVRKNIHMNRIRTEAVTQITLEDDMNIPENKPDVNALNFDKAQLVIEEVKAGTDAVNVRGMLKYAVLYHTTEEGCSLVRLEGKILFDERVNLQGVAMTDQVTAEGTVEDFSVGIINSRKLGIQSLITLQVRVEELYDEEAPVGIHGDAEVEYRRLPMKVAQLSVCKNDIFRMKEEISLPSDYPNIFQLLWSNVSLRDMEFKVMEEKLSLHGEVYVFILYEGEGEEHPVRAFETVLPLHGLLDCYGCREGMLPDINYALGQQELTIQPDFDGEERNIGLELGLDISIKIYEEEQIEILSDIYGVTKEVETGHHDAVLRRLLSKVTGKTKITQHTKLTGQKAPILQLLHSEGQISTDRQSTVENGILLEGGLRIKVMYITGDDTIPYVSTDVLIPYQYTLDVPGITPEDMGAVHGEVEQLQVNMLDSEELDIKAVLSFSTTVFQGIPISLISEVEISDIDSAVLAEIPGMAVYVVRNGDNLWNIGKRYYASVEKLRELNNLTNDELKAGQKLLIVKGA